MTVNDPSFREQLLAADEHRQRQEHYEQELKAMIEKELSRPRRLFLGAVCLAAAASGIVCGLLAATEPELPLAARIALGVGALCGLAWVVVLGRILGRGKMNLKTDARRIAQMVWIFTVLMVTFFAYLGMTAADQMKGIQMMVFGVIFLVAAGVVWLTHMVERSELATREKLLELELRLAERYEDQAGFQDG